MANPRATHLNRLLLSPHSNYCRDQWTKRTRLERLDVGLGGRKGVGRPGCGRSSSSSATPPMATVVQEPIRVGMRLVRRPTARAWGWGTAGWGRGRRRGGGAVLRGGGARAGGGVGGEGGA